MLKLQLFICFLLTNVLMFSQQNQLKALVGGTLIDGFGSNPIKNSVILIDGERITAVGTVETLPVLIMLK